MNKMLQNFRLPAAVKADVKNAQLLLTLSPRLYMVLLKDQHVTDPSHSLLKQAVLQCFIDRYSST